MAVKTGNRLPENSTPRGAWRRHGAQSAGSDISPIESFSIRVGLSVMQTGLLQRRQIRDSFGSRVRRRGYVAMAFCEKQ